MPPSLLRTARNSLHKLYRTHPIVRRFSLTAVLLVLVWLYFIHHSERTVFRSHIATCDWHTWEHWPKYAQPHRAVLIADPQLVDPHTYPGRPWPLSLLTERYTDRYMRRNYRMINEDLDPDSVIFLGDLFDGGREWATKNVPAVEPGKVAVSKILDELREKHAGNKDTYNPGWKIVHEKDSRALNKRSSQTYHDAMGKQHSRPVKKEDHGLDEEGNDLNEFVPGEDGRWKRWGNDYWEKEYRRFGNIFFAKDQLYPGSSRHLVPQSDAQPVTVNVANGAMEIAREEFAIAGGKTRNLLPSLPGNHDLGFGSGVQLPVRDRFIAHFGNPNRVDTLGNHTFVSIDAPSLAALSQYEGDGAESRPAHFEKRKHIWQPARNFLDELPVATGRAVDQALQDLYPIENTSGPDLAQTVTQMEDPRASRKARSTTEKEKRKANPQLPVVLLTHVPLHREKDTDCGSYREKGHALSISGGYQYQNVLTSSLSKMVVQKVSVAGNIAHVFSGDDHDYCDVTHRFNIDVQPEEGKSKPETWAKNIREVTVKSFSWAMGVRKPGFQLVSLWNPIDVHGRTSGTLLPTVQSHLCLLPDQLGIFVNYALLALLTLVVLLFRAIILAFRKPLLESDQDFFVKAEEFELPRFSSGSKSGTNGQETTHRSTTGRNRASSTGLKQVLNGNGNLGVQRSTNARTRSVSPGVNFGASILGTQYHGFDSASIAPSNPAPLIDRAGYYPQVKWEEPEIQSDDEESRAGDLAYDADSQAKWKHRRRSKTSMARVWDEFSSALLVVAGIAGSFYVITIRTG